MSDTAIVTGYGVKSVARGQAMKSAKSYLDQGYQITNEAFVPDGGISGCTLALLLVILFVTIIGILFLPLLLLKGKKGTYSITLSKFEASPALIGNS